MIHENLAIQLEWNTEIAYDCATRGERQNGIRIGTLGTIREDCNDKFMEGRTFTDRMMRLRLRWLKNLHRI